jgi:hypothetical protein
MACLTDSFRIIFECQMVEGSRMAVSSEGQSTSSRSSSVVPAKTARSVYFPAPPDDVMIFIRKYLTSADPRMRMTAVVGSVAYLSQSRWLDAWERRYGEEATGASAVEAAVPYTQHATHIIRVCADNVQQFSFLMTEMKFWLEETLSSSHGPSKQLQL